MVLKQKDKKELDDIFKTQTVSKIWIELKNNLGFSYNINDTDTELRKFKLHLKKNSKRFINM